MKKTSKVLVLTAAMSGLISGVALEQGRAEPTNAAPGKIAQARKVPKIHDCAAQNDCKGIGGCKTEEHTCKFKNTCKGKGGCEIKDKDIKTWEKKQKEDAAKAAGKTSEKASAPLAPKTDHP